MFPKNKINIVYRLLCLFSFIMVILLTKSSISLIVLFIIYCVLTIPEKNFRNIEFMAITLLLLLFCYWINNYLLLRIMLIVDYVLYSLDSSYYVSEKEEILFNQKEYIRFAKNNQNKKGTNNLSAIYITVHLVLLVIAIVVG